MRATGPHGGFVSLTAEPDIALSAWPAEAHDRLRAGEPPGAPIAATHQQPWRGDAVVSSWGDVGDVGGKPTRAGGEEQACR